MQILEEDAILCFLFLRGLGTLPFQPEGQLECRFKYKVRPQVGSANQFGRDVARPWLIFEFLIDLIS